MAVGPPGPAQVTSPPVYPPPPMNQSAATPQQAPVGPPPAYNTVMEIEDEEEGVVFQPIAVDNSLFPDLPPPQVALPKPVEPSV